MRETWLGAFSRRGFVGRQASQVNRVPAAVKRGKEALESIR